MVDLKRRPLIELRRTNGRSNILALVDTGCDGALVVDAETAKELGVAIGRQSIAALMGDGSEVVFTLGRLEIIWRGVPRVVSVRVSQSNTKLFDDRFSLLEPQAIIGCELLAQSELRVNFCDDSVSLAPCL
jgi:predicted aspartyl protease